MAPKTQNTQAKAAASSRAPRAATEPAPEAPTHRALPPPRAATEVAPEVSLSKFSKAWLSPKAIVLDEEVFFDDFALGLLYVQENARWETRSYGLDTYILAPFCSTARCNGPHKLSLACHPQDRLGLLGKGKRQKKENEQDSARYPDATLIGLYSTNPKSIEDTMVFAIWEKKPLPLKNWFGEDAKIHVGVNWLGHMKQVGDQALAAFSQYKNTNTVYAFLVIGVYFSFLKYVRPATLEGMDGTQMIPDLIYSNECLVTQDLRSFTPSFRRALRKTLPFDKIGICTQPSWYDPPSDEESSDDRQARETEMGLSKQSIVDFFARKANALIIESETETEDETVKAKAEDPSVSYRTGDLPPLGVRLRSRQ